MFCSYFLFDNLDTETESLTESDDSKPKELTVPPEIISIDHLPKDADNPAPLKDDPANPPSQPVSAPLQTTNSSSSTQQTTPSVSLVTEPLEEVPSESDTGDAQYPDTKKENVSEDKEEETSNAEEDKKRFGSETSSSIAEDGDVDVKRTPKSTDQYEGGEPLPNLTFSESSSPSNTEYYCSEVSTIFNRWALNLCF